MLRVIFPKVPWHSEYPLSPFSLKSDLLPVLLQGGDQTSLALQGQLNGLLMPPSHRSKQAEVRWDSPIVDLFLPLSPRVTTPFLRSGALYWLVTIAFQLSATSGGCFKNTDS